MMPLARPHAPNPLLLGTALWGWGVDRATALKLLDRFYGLGGRIVDTASNYPINKRAEDHGRALTWIAEWVASNAEAELAVLVKVGAVDNVGSDLVDLSSTNILNSAAMLRERLGRTLGAISIHWDNRGDMKQDQEGIAQTVEALALLHETGLSVGFSGVRRPDLYLKAAPELAGNWWIQVKENVQTNSARMNYTKYFPHARYLAYGINMGGFKLEPPSEGSSLTMRGLKIPEEVGVQMAEILTTDHGLSPTPKNVNDLALLAACLNPCLSGVIIGPRSVGQLESAMSFRGSLMVRSNEATVAVLTRLGLIRGACAG